MSASLTYSKVDHKDLILFTLSGLYVFFTVLFVFRTFYRENIVHRYSPWLFFYPVCSYIIRSGNFSEIDQYSRFGYRMLMKLWLSCCIFLVQAQ